VRAFVPRPPPPIFPHPARNSTIIRQDHPHSCRKSLFFFFCLLGLLFLLAKEDRTEGSAQIVVQGHGFLHQTQLPVYSVPQVQDLAARVSYARSLSASAASGF
jgi:hypothetical protein